MLLLLFSILSQKRYLATAVIVFSIFVVLYLAVTQFLILERRIGTAGGFFEVRIAENWLELMFRQRAPFLFEPIGVLSAGMLKLFISVPNILLAVALGTLVASNLTVSYYSFHTLSLRGPRGIMALLGTVPAIISGAACCVPTLILVIGLQFTATLAAMWPFFVPLSFLLLIAALWWALYKATRSYGTP